MSKSKKPRKKYTPKPAHIPMMASMRDRLALDLHLSIEALIEASSPDTYNALSTKLCTMGYAGVVSPYLEAAKQTLGVICERYERFGKVGVSSDEALALRALAGELDALLATVPATKIIRAEAFTALHCAELGIT